MRPAPAVRATGFLVRNRVWLGFSVTPAKVFAHAKGDPFGATTHKFRRDGQSR
jgi:hypothetical protein